MFSLAWICLIAAGLLEPCWAVSLKRSGKFRNVRWSVATVVFLIGSLYLLSFSMITLPAGTAYAVWTGIGAAGTFVYGILFMNDPYDVMRIMFAVMVIAGIVGLQRTSSRNLG
ncbi:MAG: multidrug efflux SMR transporter [Methanomassiliicoccaceae archaeon]|nr:multidrug efflux SMR transporter [Methanomassiliicoccaceae archaeon]